ncbi:hypothetical protein BCR34DRAFT_602387 [Clohesyomyces aquaticus]|uniref:Uncharacterized protein n=1 Tax=Clohesyomyces aquaticus TaxID=1231657 RepID=A0A1Y1ZIK1_9PLEO|nr:hypothetical protein BCR34DRAFT_602387 [Clohesyomyces aquaticus]
MSTSTNENLHPRLVQSGPGQAYSNYSYLDGTMYSNDVKRNSADDIRRRLRKYNDNLNPVTKTVDLNKDIIRKELIDALNKDWVRMCATLGLISPLNRKMTLVGKITDSSLLDPLVRVHSIVLRVGAVIQVANISELKKLANGPTEDSGVASGQSPSIGMENPSKRARVDDGHNPVHNKTNDWIDRNEPVFKKESPKVPAALLKKLSAIDKARPTTRPRVFAKEGPDGAGAIYSYLTGSFTWTRIPVFLQRRLNADWTLKH